MPVEFIRVTPGKTRKVKITADTRVLGTHVSEGQVIEVEEMEAHNLIVAHKAHFYVEPVKESAKAGK